MSATPPFQTGESLQRQLAENSGKVSPAQLSDSEGERYAADEYTAEDRLRQAQEIENEQNQRALIGWKEPGVGSLFEELKASPSFVRKLPYLSKGYSGLRRVRGDGNCFYRGFCFRLIEEMMRDKAFFKKAKAKIDSVMAYLLSAGYLESAVEFFVEEAQSFFNDQFPKHEVDLEIYFADPQQSMYLVWFTRLLTAAYIKLNWEERFQFFVEGVYANADAYCAKEVEPTDCDASQIQVTALCEFFEVRTAVEYLDANESSDETMTYFFGPDTELNPATKKQEPAQPKIHLLYRPGHYDILYPKVMPSPKPNQK